MVNNVDRQESSSKALFSRTTPIGSCCVDQYVAIITPYGALASPVKYNGIVLDTKAHLSHCHCVKEEWLVLRMPFQFLQPHHAVVSRRERQLCDWNSGPPGTPIRISPVFRYNWAVSAAQHAGSTPMDGCSIRVIYKRVRMGFCRLFRVDAEALRLDTTARNVPARRQPQKPWRLVSNKGRSIENCVGQLDMRPIRRVGTPRLLGNGEALWPQMPNDTRAGGRFCYP